MSDKITTLHLKNDPTTNVYPNVKIENIPLDATITADGKNLVQTKNIYGYTHRNFLSLDGGTMDGQIRINGIATPERTILGDGLEVVEESNPAEPGTHYGCGYIRQDDDEDSSIKYNYNFPKKSGTLALDNILNLEKRTENFESFFTKTINEESREIRFTLSKEIPNGIYIYTQNDDYFRQFRFPQQIKSIIVGSALYGSQSDFLRSITPYPYNGATLQFDLMDDTRDFVIYVIGSIMYIDLSWEI